MRISRIIAPRRSEIVEAPDPVPTDDEVLVDVLACGVCTSDLSVWQNGGTGAGADGPTQLGHEIVGRVIGVGAHAGRWRDGDIVTGLGGNGFASRAVLEAASVLPVPAGLAPHLAIGEPVADLEEAIGRTPVTSDSVVAVVGLGFMGLTLLQLARTRAPRLVIGVDPSEPARRRATALGADLVFAPDEVPDRFRSAVADGAQDARPDVVLEATGATAGLSTAGSLVRPFGTLAVIGYHHAGTAKMDMSLWYKAVTIVNGFCPDRGRLVVAMDRALGLMASRRISLEPLVTHRVGLEGIDEAYRLMEARDPAYVKAVLEP